ncbi:ubiquitin carboxyl-terminal hydrolase 37-like [Halichoeres trimaculatus]|uniref:ubiquitin carboxyl-terminal hydrolase 37-like n=1 Tax=Halichoeres trimaculatus TaxID=147232 RepID=UPI003D9EA98B
MNSSLQSLLTLEDFVRDVSCQEEVWSPVPQAQLIRLFMAIRDAHTSTDTQRKIGLLRSFKKVVSVQGSEFSNSGQKDAHEFLTSVLDQIRSLAPLLHNQAAGLGRKYRCPVKKHLLFKMETIRTCRSCGVQSRRTEEFTNLSVDLLPEGSVEQIIESYQRETELEFKCECGGNVSQVRTEFKTLPKVLILHLKRFSCCANNKLRKVRNPVELLRDLVLPSKEEASCYSLVSMISHYGWLGAGHYICDSISPDDDPDKPTDNWLTFDDTKVTETTGRSVCGRRQESAYILVYKRRVVKLDDQTTTLSSPETVEADVHLT